MIGDAVVTAFPAIGRAPSIRSSGWPRQWFSQLCVGPVYQCKEFAADGYATLERAMGIGHALASRQLYTDGTEVLYDFGAENVVDPEVVASLVVVRNGQRVFVDVVREELKRIEFAADGYATLLRVPGDRSDLVCDPTRSFGRPIFVCGGTRVDDVILRFQTGESIEELTEEFGMSVADVEDALRVASRRAA